MLQDLDLYWLAGILEGEGYFFLQTNKFPVGLSLEMTDEDIVKRVSLLINAKYYKCHSKKDINLLIS